MKNLIFTLFFALITANLPAQNETGYWAQELMANESKIFETNFFRKEGERNYFIVKLPTGTTKIAYTAHFWNKDQKLDNSLKLLSNIPTKPTQAASALLGLIKDFGGENKCQYVIFTKQSDADYFVANNKVRNHCYGDFKITKGGIKGFFELGENCLQSETKFLYFAFSNQNLNDDIKIHLEVLPWVDNKSAKGWTKDIKDSYYAKCEGKLMGNQTAYGDKICGCFLERIQDKYTVVDLYNMIDKEIDYAVTELVNECSEIYVQDNNSNQETQDPDKPCKGCPRSMVKLNSEDAINLSKPEIKIGDYGYAVVKVKVDKEGNVVYAFTKQTGSSGEISDYSWNLIYQAAMKTKFKPDASAGEELRTGILKYEFQ